MLSSYSLKSLLDTIGKIPLTGILGEESDARSCVISSLV